MRYVTDMFDPRAYLAVLPELLAALPPGAAAFAADPDHYDFYGLRCVKDLAVGEVLHDERAATARIRFTGNPWKHDEDLIVRYSGVTSFDVTGIGTVTLDEILPAPEGGCRHEIGGHDGDIVVVCADLTASWERVPRPDDPPAGSWTPVLPLGDRWNWLGLRDGDWVVGTPHRATVPARDRMDALCHVLRRPWRTVTAQWPATAPPLDGLVEHALGFDGWECLLALDWLEDGYPPSDAVRARLEALRKDRHRAAERRKRAGLLLRQPHRT